MSKPKKPRSRAGSYSTFEKRYKPIEVEDSDGLLLREYQEIPLGTSERYVWTVVEAEGRMYLIAGRHLVNRIGYVLCEVPYTDDEEDSPGYVF